MRQSAINEREISAAMICEKVPTIARDLKLKALFEQNDTLSPADMVKAICVIGSQAQRSRLAMILEPKHALAMNALVVEASDRESHKMALNFLKAQLQSLADFYGCTIAGNLPDMADVFFESHCDLSILDFTLFFQYVKQGRYKGDFEHVVVRGINMQFVNDWMEKYREERDEARQAIHEEIKGRQKSEPIQESIYEKYIQMVKKREEQQKGIRGMRIQWANETQGDWFAKMHMVCHWAFSDDPDRAMAAIKTYVQTKTKTVANPKDYYLPTVAPILNAISAKGKKEGASVFMLNALISQREQLKTPDAIWEKCFPGTQIPDAWFEKDYAQICSAICSGAIVRIEKGWPDFRERIVETPDAIPFDQEEYMHMRSVTWLKQIGINSPMWAYLYHLLSV